MIFPAYNEVKCMTQTSREATAYFEHCQHRSKAFVSADGNDGTRAGGGMAR
jgi:hypothetical protein